MKFMTKARKGAYTNNNVNICINVNKYENSDNDYLHDKVTSLTSDLNLLESNVERLTSAEAFEEKLNEYFDLSEREKIKTLINNQSYDALSEYISNYDQFSLLINEGIKISYKETEIILNEYSSNSLTMITAQIGQETIILNDVTNNDNDNDTVYKIPIDGFVIGIEIYSSTESNSIRETFFGIKTSYNSTSKTSYVFLTHDDYKIVYDKFPNNKLVIHSLIIK